MGQESISIRLNKVKRIILLKKDLKEETIFYDIAKQGTI